MRWRAQLRTRSVADGRRSKQRHVPCCTMLLTQLAVARPAASVPFHSTNTPSCNDPRIPQSKSDTQTTISCLVLSCQFAFVRN